jgi:hypothetical protein
MKAKLAILKAHGGPNFERTRDSLVSDAHLFQQMVELKRRSVYSQNYRPADDANVIMAIPTIVLWKSPPLFLGDYKPRPIGLELVLSLFDEGSECPRTRSAQYSAANVT